MWSWHQISTVLRGMTSLCLVTLGLLCPQITKAGEAFQLSERMDGEPLGLFFDTFEDRNGQLTLDDILRIDAAGGLQPSHEKVPNYGLNPATQWVKFSLHNPFDQPTLILLEQKFTFTDNFTLYYQNSENSWQFKQAGDQLPFVQREIQTRQAVFRFHLSPGTHTFYARTRTDGTHQLPLHIWTQDNFFQHNAAEFGFIGVLVGFHVVVCLYNLFLFFSLKDRTYFLYVAYVTCNLIYQGSGLSLFQQMFSQLGLMESLPNSVMIVAVDLVSITALLFSYNFLNIRKKLPRFRLIFIAIGTLDMLNIGITIFASIHIGTVVCLLTASMSTSVLIASGFLIARQGYLPAVFYLTAWGCYLLGVTGTISNLIGLLPTSVFSRWGQFTGGAIEIAILSLALGARINEKSKKSMLKITELNMDLENKVKDRTAEIQSLLLHIPQGILSIGPQGLINPNFSAQLPQILGHKDLAFQSFREMVLDRSTLSEDEKDQAWQTLLASIGESSLNFDLNVDKLPVHLTCILNGSRKALRLTWNRELTASDEIKHILVTLLDVSSEVAAQHEIARQNQEFELIKQLVEIGSKKSIQFFSSGDQLMEENERLVHAPVLDSENIKILFVNTHTLKGAARSLQLKELANELHKIEAYYSIVLKEAQSIDPSRVQQEFRLVQTVYKRYKRANTEVLGRSDDMKKVSVDRGFIQDNIKLLCHLANIDDLAHDLKSMILLHRDELTNIIFMSLPIIISDFMQHADKIAKDLGREPPVVEIDADDILVNYSQELALKNTFIHLLRNSLDHGIEPGWVRQASGKPARGKISVRAYEAEGQIYIELKDDGKGLAMGKIRTNGLPEQNELGEADLEEIASRIFETGFSTAESVSMMSGRGVGLSAVRQFLSAEGGSVSIILHQALDENHEFFAFSIRITLPLIATFAPCMPTFKAS